MGTRFLIVIVGERGGCERGSLAVQGWPAKCAWAEQSRMAPGRGTKQVTANRFGLLRSPGAIYVVQRAGVRIEHRLGNLVAEMGLAGRDQKMQVVSAARRPRRLVLRVVLAAAMAVVGLNLWTGAPLFSLWVGSRFQHAQAGGLTMATVGIVFAVMAVSIFVLYRALQWLDVRFGEVIGRKPGTRQALPWLKSVSGERLPAKRPREPLTPLERALVLIVLVAVGCFEVWFFFFAGSSLPNQ